MTNLKAWVIAIAAVLAAGGAAASTVGSGTYQTPGDLTVVVDPPVRYEFLDLSVTLDLTQAEALADFGPDGFAIATYDDLLILLAAFGFPTPAFPTDSGATLAVFGGSPDTTGLVAALGETFSTTVPPAQTSSYGTFLAPDGDIAFFCVSSVGTCTKPDITAELKDFNNDGNSGFAPLMVRTAVIPLPASLPLLAAGLGAVVLMRRRKTGAV